MADYRLQVSASDPQTRLAQKMADLDSRLARIENAPGVKILDTYIMPGAYEGYVTITAVGQGVYVDAAQSVPLRWVYTPPVDAWVETVTFAGQVYQFGSATWEYLYLQTTCSPAPISGNAATLSIGTQHNAAPYGTRMTSKIWPVTAGVTYTFGNGWAGTGGAIWQVYHGSGYLHMHGKSWPR